jgi:hypothetical protein
MLILKNIIILFVEMITNVECIQLLFDEDVSLVIVLLDDFNNDPWWLARILCEVSKLNNDMNFLASGEVRFNVIKIGKLNGENISTKFVEVQSELQLKARKGKMMKPQLTMETNVESFATQKKNKRVKKEKTKDEK